LLEGKIPLTETVVEHFDRCLGCMACVTACPSGVQYDRLIEDTRAYVEAHHERSPGDKLVRSLIFALFPHPRRLRLALKLAPRGPARGGTAAGAAARGGLRARRRRPRGRERRRLRLEPEGVRPPDRRRGVRVEGARRERAARRSARVAGRAAAARAVGRLPGL